jgi:hypothetical protein
VRRPTQAIVAISAMLLTLALGATLASADNPPSLSVEAASDVAYTSATLHGKVNPEGGPSTTSWHFEYSATPEGEESWVQFDGGGSFEGTEAEKTEALPVQSNATGLQPDHTYLVRLVAENEGGANRIESPAPYTSFTTKAVAKPQITSPLSVSAISADGAHFAAKVDPSGSGDPAFDTQWTFSCTPKPCFTGKGKPLSGTVAAGAPQDIEVDAAFLHPNIEYTVKLTATNLGGEVEETETFTTPGGAPTVEAHVADPVSFDRATVNAEIDPRGSDTEYWFEWGSADCSTSSCQKTPLASLAFDEVQQLVVVASAGQFTLSFEGQSTANLPFNASAAQIKTALEALSTVGPGNVTLTGSLGRYRVTFAGELAGEDVEALSAADGSTPLTTNEGKDPGSIGVETRIEGGLHPEPRFVTHQLTGLSPLTTYHFRVVAENESGPTQGSDQQFTTAAAPSACANDARRVEQQSAYLPDCRAYEMVSPTDKEGGNVIADSSNVNVAVDGNAAVFSSLTGFAEPEGMAGAAQYMSQRQGAPGTSGWSTHPITPKLDALAVSQVLRSLLPGYEAFFTPDLSQGIFRTATPLTGDPWVSNTVNFYRRGDLRGEGATSQLLSGCPLCAQTETPLPPSFLRPRIADASRDLSHVTFRSLFALAPGATPGAQNLYESVDGEVRLAGILPDGNPAPESGPGVGNFGSNTYVEPNTISADGSRVFFNVPSSGGLLPNGGDLYMRENGATTVQLNKSEKTSPESPQPAALYAASEDGSRAFFITDEGLVDEDDNNSRDVYMYDVSEPAGERLTLLSVDHEPADGYYAQTVLGASADGHYVYFATDGQLVNGQPLIGGRLGLYLWHDGVVKYVGAFIVIGDTIINSPQTRGGFPATMKTSRVSPDGRHLLFMSRDNASFEGRGGFPGYDQGSKCTFDISDGAPCRTLFLYSADSGRLACVSCGAPGTVASSDALDNALAGQGATGRTFHQSHALSDDGRYVFFHTGQSLVSRDTNGAYDVYEYDARTGNVQLISSGTAKEDSFFLEATDDGSDVFFATTQRLLGWDKDGSYDLYDARIDGGFSEPVPVPAPCEGESCRAGAAPAPGPAPNGSAAVQGRGNVSPRCPKGRRAVKRHGRSVCVKKKQHKRTANDDRRAGR